MKLKSKKGVLKVDIKKLDERPMLDTKIPLKVKSMGNITELQYMAKRNTEQTIQMLPGLNENGKREIIIVSSGEVKECNTYTSRADNYKGLKKTFQKCRDLINTNVVDVNNVRWITLTYAENMTDTKRLYTDFEKFNKRFQYFCQKKNYGKAEYIVMMEPQGRGAWHVHLLYIWQCRAPYIANDILRDIWQKGFVKIKKLDNVDNVGAYLTAYLGDMEFDNVSSIPSGWDFATIKTVDIENEEGQIETKRFIKGARLSMYPSNFNMIRYSRGIKKPIVDFMTHSNAEKKVSGATLTFETSYKITDVKTNYSNTINVRYYNHKRTQQ